MAKSYVNVVIDNKVLTLGGTEKEAYYQEVANYVNEKIGSLRGEPGFNQQTRDYQNILIYCNIADDYLKTKGRFEEVCALVDKQAKDVYKLKHDLVADKIKIEKLEKELAALKAEAKSVAPVKAVDVEVAEPTESAETTERKQKAAELAKMDAETPMMQLEMEEPEAKEVPAEPAKAEPKKPARKPRKKAATATTE